MHVRPSSGRDVYPHMPILCVASALDESASARYGFLCRGLVTSNFSRRFIGVQGKESPILRNIALPEAENRTNRSLA